MKSLNSFVFIILISLFFSLYANARANPSAQTYGKFFKEYSVKNIAKAKSAKAKRLRAALEDGDVMMEYTYSKKIVSGDKHSLLNLKAVVMKKINDNLIKQPKAHLIPSPKIGATICSFEGHNSFYRTRVKIESKNKDSFVIMMSDRFHQRVLAKDIEKKRIKGSKISPNDASEILISKSYLKSVEALCSE